MSTVLLFDRKATEMLRTILSGILEPEDDAGPGAAKLLRLFEWFTGSKSKEDDVFRVIADVGGGCADGLCLAKGSNHVHRRR